MTYPVSAVPPREVEPCQTSMFVAAASAHKVFSAVRDKQPSEAASVSAALAAQVSAGGSLVLAHLQERQVRVLDPFHL